MSEYAKESVIRNLPLIESWVTRLKEFLVGEDYSQPAIKNYCLVARRFVRSLERRKITLESVEPPDVDSFLRVQLAQYRRDHDHKPGCMNDWRWHYLSPIQILLRLAQGRWPPANQVDTRLAWFGSQLADAKHTPRTIGHYIQVARRFLTFLVSRRVPPENVAQADVAEFVGLELRRFQQQRDRTPSSLTHWRCGLTSSIHYLLRLIQGVWPPPTPYPYIDQLRELLQNEFSCPKTPARYVCRCRSFIAFLETRHLTLQEVELQHVDEYCRRQLMQYRQRHRALPANMHRWRLGIQAPIHRLLRLVQGCWPPGSSPDPTLGLFRAHLAHERFSPSVIPSKMSVVRGFLRFLKSQSVGIEQVKPEHVERYIKFQLAEFEHIHHRAPTRRAWRYGYTGSIHRYLRLVLGKWPPDKPAADEKEQFRRQVYKSYERWMVDLHGFAGPTVRKNGHAAQVFMEWLGERADREALASLGVADIDAFLAWRNQRLRRATRRGVSHCLRSFLHFLYSDGLIKRDLAPLVSAPIVYRFERIPSAMTAEQIKTLLSATRSDRTPNGLRDYGILLLFATYGLRAGEVVRMRLDDINWRQDKIQVKQSKGGAELSLPLTPEVGEAILRYLRRGRSETDRREIFLRARVPHGPFSCGSSLYSVVQRRLRKAGIEIQGKSGPHTIRYARAISLLRATVRLKTIGDVLGHRSAAATEVYLKLATDDLRSVALELPNGAA